MRRLISLAAPFRWWMLLAALLGFATIGSSIGLMAVAAWIIATAALHPSVAVLNVAVVGVRFFGISRGVFRYLERYVSHQTTFRLLARLRVWFYEALEPLAPARLMQYRSGDLLARVVADIDTLENFYLRVIAPPAIALLIGLAMFVFFAITDLRLALVLIAFLALAGIGVPLVTQGLSRRTGRALIAVRSELNVALVDGIQGMADLTAFGAEDRQAERVASLSRELTREQARMAQIGGLNTALGTLLVWLAAVAILILAVPMVRRGDLDGVMLAVLVLAAISSFEAVLPLPQAFQHWGSNLDAARRLFEIVDAVPAVDAGQGRLAVVDQPTLEVENLRFRYTPDDVPALDGISLTLHAGGTMAIVGASGAGKSTLVNLLMRFWEYEEGQIRLGGRELRDYTPEAVRAYLGVVSQNTYLFNSTIRDNLRIARPDASEEDLILAAQRAQIHDFIMTLPQGYDTWIGEQGLRLSGGERQRIALARAILKDAPVLILDEATANLDTITEREVLRAIQGAMVGRSTLVITHRLVEMEKMDEILVLQAGQLVERGTHADLMQLDGAYRRMWTLQREALEV
ncbi:MAG TPA: thiol reductant ABC exporter subunit CydC [Aggregatilineaceae bacterium]|nr:thiol reductant ABC exporter subunit CydC [Aggregatilineaceae bacterium]